MNDICIWEDTSGGLSLISQDLPRLKIAKDKTDRCETASVWVCTDELFKVVLK